MTITIATTAKLHHATRAKAEKLAGILAAEYPILTLVPEYNEDESAVTMWRIVAKDDEATLVLETAKVPDLADVLDACEEAGIDPETEVDGEEGTKASGSVVPEHYRQQYQLLSSNGQTCGDWLAERLVADTHGIEGFHVEDFTAILNANGVDMTMPWARLPESGQKGWIGRYRMNGRQVLEKVVALVGYYIDHTGAKCLPHADWLEKTRTKHSKWIAKQEKLAKAALNMEAA